MRKGRCQLVQMVIRVKERRGIVRKQCRCRDSWQGDWYWSRPFLDTLNTDANVAVEVYAQGRNRAEGSGRWWQVDTERASSLGGESDRCRLCNDGEGKCRGAELTHLLLLLEGVAKEERRIE